MARLYPYEETDEQTFDNNASSTNNNERDQAQNPENGFSSDDDVFYDSHAYNEEIPLPGSYPRSRRNSFVGSNPYPRHNSFNGNPSIPRNSQPPVSIFLQLGNSVPPMNTLPSSNMYGPYQSANFTPLNNPPPVYEVNQQNIINGLVAENLTLRAQESQQRDQINFYIQALYQLKDHLETRDQELYDSDCEIDTKNRQLQECKDKIRELNRSIEFLKTGLQQTDYDSLNQLHRKAQSDLNDCRLESEDRLEQIDQLKKTIEELQQAQAAPNQACDHEQTISNLTEQIVELKQVNVAEKERHRQQLEASYRSCKNTELKLNNKINECDRLKQEIEKLNGRFTRVMGCVKNKMRKGKQRIQHLFTLV